MRRLTYALMIASIAAVGGRLAAQPKPTMTFTGGATTNVDAWNGTTMVSVGTTDVSGALSYDPSKLGGKPLIDIRFAQCLSSNQNHIDLFPDVPANQTAENNCPPGCTCTHKKDAFAWGSSFTAQTPFGPAGASPGQSNFFDKPLNDVLVGGSVAAVAVILATRGSSTTTGGTTGTVTFANILNTYTITGVSSSGCGFSPTSTGTAVIGGTMSATTTVVTLFSSVFSFSGSTIAGSAANTFDFSGTGGGSISTGSTLGTAGTYTGSVSGQTNATTFSATVTLGAATCGTVSITLTGTVV